MSVRPTVSEIVAILRWSELSASDALEIIQATIGRVRIEQPVVAPEQCDTQLEDVLESQVGPRYCRDC